MANARRVNGLYDFGISAQAFHNLAHCTRNGFPLYLFDDRGGAQRQEPHHRAHLEPCRASVRQAQQVVVEAVLFVPHAIRTGWRGHGNIAKMLGKLDDHILIGRVMGGERNRELQHVLAEQRHPGRSIRLLKMPAGRQRRAAVKDADVVQSKEAALKHILAESVLAVHPPGEVRAPVC